MKSLFPDICTDKLSESKEFYVGLLGFSPVLEIDGYVQHQSPNDDNLQIAFVRRDHPSVPDGYQQSPQGVIVTAEVEAVDPVYESARSRGDEIRRGRECAWSLRRRRLGLRELGGCAWAWFRAFRDALEETTKDVGAGHDAS